MMTFLSLISNAVNGKSLPDFTITNLPRQNTENTGGVTVKAMALKMPKGQEELNINR